MRGSTFKRCRTCCARARGRRCDRCGSGDLTWGFVVDVGRTGDGRRQQRHRQGFETRRLAERALADLLHEVGPGAVVPSHTVTLGSFLEREWLPAIQPPAVRHSTYGSYRAELRRHVIPRLGALRLSEIRPDHLNRLYAHLLADGRLDGTGGLSPRTVRYVHVIVHRALRDAVRWDRLGRNPAARADPPPNPVPGTGIATWSAAQVAAFLDHVAGLRLSAAWRVAAMTGMRRGEVLGLRWVDVDPDRRRLAVRQTYVSVDGRGRFSPPKTRRSRRTVDLDADTVRALRGWRATQRAELERWGEAAQDVGLAFAREDGSPVHPDAFSRTFRALSRGAGLPPIALRDLRHTHATLLLADGANPKVVSERLGHHSTAFTLDTYAHVLPGMQAEAAERAAGMVRRHRARPAGPDGDGGQRAG